MKLLNNNELQAVSGGQHVCSIALQSQPTIILRTFTEIYNKDVSAQDNRNIDAIVDSFVHYEIMGGHQSSANIPGTPYLVTCENLPKHPDL